MAYHLVNVDTGNFDIEEDFWQWNPQLKFYPVFSSLYNRDKSKGKVHSSKVMWCVWMLNDPRQTNTVYRQLPEHQRQIIEAYYAKFYKISDDEREELSEAFRNYCLSPAKRAFIDAEQTLEKRARFLRETDYTLDGPMYDNDGMLVTDARGNPIIAKGNAKDLDTLHKNTLAIVEQYDKAKSFFEDDEENSSRIHGGRDETLREKGGLVREIDEEE